MWLKQKSRRHLTTNVFSMKKAAVKLDCAHISCQSGTRIWTSPSCGKSHVIPNELKATIKSIINMAAIFLSSPADPLQVPRARFSHFYQAVSHCDSTHLCDCYYNDSVVCRPAPAPFLRHWKYLKCSQSLKIVICDVILMHSPKQLH